MKKDPLEEYIRETEPDKAYKIYAWRVAIGFSATNDIFAENAWYFRNALVRANYTNLQEGVHKTTEYLESFLENLLLGEDNELQNRDLHIGALGNE